MRITRHFGGALLCAALTLAAACHDQSTAPHNPGTFDAAQALTKVQPVTAVVDQSIMHSFDRALTYFEQFLRSTPSLTLGSAGTPAGLGLRLSQTLAPAADLRADAIPDDDKGKTFVYDVAANTYVPDPTATGAPASGVRYVLYAWVEGQQAPPLPLTRIGYVDIAPVGPGTSTGPQLTEALV